MITPTNKTSSYTQLALIVALFSCLLQPAAASGDGWPSMPSMGEGWNFEDFPEPVADLTAPDEGRLSLEPVAAAPEPNKFNQAGKSTWTEPCEVCEGKYALGVDSCTRCNGDGYEIKGEHDANVALENSSHRRLQSNESDGMPKNFAAKPDAVTAQDLENLQVGDRISCHYYTQKNKTIKKSPSTLKATIYSLNSEKKTVDVTWDPQCVSCYKTVTLDNRDAEQCPHCNKNGRWCDKGGRQAGTPRDWVVQILRRASESKFAHLFGKILQANWQEKGDFHNAVVIDVRGDDAKEMVVQYTDSGPWSKKAEIVKMNVNCFRIPTEEQKEEMTWLANYHDYVNKNKTLDTSCPTLFFSPIGRGRKLDFVPTGRNGYTYKGQFKEVKISGEWLPMPQGVGFLRFPKGRKCHLVGLSMPVELDYYLGKFHKGKMHGKGRVYLKNGAAYWATFNNGVQDGPALYPNSSTYAVLTYRENGKHINFDKRGDQVSSDDSRARRRLVKTSFPPFAALAQAIQEQ